MDSYKDNKRKYLLIYQALDVQCWSLQSSTGFLDVLIIYSVECFG